MLRRRGISQSPLECSVLTHSRDLLAKIVIKINMPPILTGPQLEPILQQCTILPWTSQSNNIHLGLAKLADPFRLYLPKVYWSKPAIYGWFVQVGIAALLITQEGKRVELVLQRSHKREAQSQINKFQSVALVQEDLPYN